MGEKNCVGCVLERRVGKEKTVGSYLERRRDATVGRNGRPTTRQGQAAKFTLGDITEDCRGFENG